MFGGKGGDGSGGGGGGATSKGDTGSQSSSASSTSATSTSTAKTTKYSLASMTVDTTGLDVLEQYAIGRASVFITNDGRYLVREPHLPREAGDMYDRIVKRINTGVGFTAEDDSDAMTMARKFEDSFWDVARRIKEYDAARRLFPDLKYYIHRELAGYGVIDVPMRDPDIEDILCSAPGRAMRVNHKRFSGRFHSLETNIQFDKQRDMERFIQRVYGRTGTEPTESKPMSVTYMADGSRISSTFGSQVSTPGAVIAIRKFPQTPLTITHMIESGTLTARMAAYAWTMCDAKAVGLVIGVTGSGKTTLLGSLVSMMNPRWRILTIEDTLELQIPHHDWVRLKTRKSYGMLSESYDIPIRSLIDISLTQKPDYEIVGEIRLSDMDALFQSVGTGHGGLTSFHASNPEGALTRMRGNGISDGELALIWFTVHSAVYRKDGRNVRRVSNISEVLSDDEGKVAPRTIFRYDPFADGGAGRFVEDMPVHDSQRYGEAVQVCGIDDPRADFDRRVQLLERCVEEKAHDVQSVFSVLGEYYGHGGE